MARRIIVTRNESQKTRDLPLGGSGDAWWCPPPPWRREHPQGRTLLRASVASVGPWVLVVGLAGDADPLPMLPVLLGAEERDGDALLGVGLGGARAPPVGDAFEEAAGGEAPTARLVGRRPLFRPEEGDEGGLVCWYPIAGGSTTDSFSSLSFSSLLFPSFSERQRPFSNFRSFLEVRHKIRIKNGKTKNQIDRRRHRQTDRRAGDAARRCERGREGGLRASLYPTTV